MTAEGKDPQTIRDYIDAQYSQYGPPTDTEPISDLAPDSCTREAATSCGEPSGDQSGAFDAGTIPRITVPQSPDDGTGDATTDQ